MTKIYDQKKRMLVRHPKVQFIGGVKVKIYRHPKIKNQDFYLYKTFHRANGTDRIYRPILTPDEYVKRKNNVYNAAARFLMRAEELEQKKEAENAGIKD